MKKTKKKILILTVVSIVISVIYELVMKYGFKNSSDFFVDKIIIDSLIVFFIGLHFIFIFSDIYDFIIKHRYKISGVLLILFTLLQYSGMQTDLLTTTWIKYIHAFWWNLKLFALLLASFEFCMLLTKQNEKISLCGSVVIAFSGICQWMFSERLIEIIILGELLIVLLDKFLLENKFKKKILYSLGMSICIILYAFTREFSLMISFGYIFLALAIWVFIKNRKFYKINKKDVVLFIINLLLIIGNEYIYYVIIGNGNQNSLVENVAKGGGISYLFSYLYNFLLPFIDVGNEYKVANIVSLFPIPMIIAIYYMYKKDDDISFLLPVSMVTVLETVFCLSGLPDVVSKFTLFRFVSLENAIIAVGFANLYILLYMITNMEEEIIKFKVTIRISLIVMFIIFFINLPEVFLTTGYQTIFSCMLCLLTFLFLNNNDKRYRKVLLAFMVLMTLAGGVFVNPITKSGNVVKQIKSNETNQQIVNEK